MTDDAVVGFFSGAVAGVGHWRLVPPPHRDKAAVFPREIWKEEREMRNSLRTNKEWKLYEEVIAKDLVDGLVGRHRWWWWCYVCR